MASVPPRPSVVTSIVSRENPLEPGDEHDLLALEGVEDADRRDLADLRPRVHGVGDDPGLRAGEGDGLVAEVVHRHRDERASDALPGREQHVELARVRVRRDAARELEQESVVRPIAETVPTTRTPRSWASTRRRATPRIRSGSATDVPPNFITTVSTGGWRLGLMAEVWLVATRGPFRMARRGRPARTGREREGGGMKRTTRIASVVALVAFALVPTAAQADPSFYESPIFGSTTAGSSLLVADAGRGVVNGDSGALVAALPGISDVAVRSGGGLWAVTGAGEDPEEDTGQGVWRISGSTATLVANLFEYEEKLNPHPATVDSNPFDVADVGGGKAVVADAGGNSLLLVGDGNSPVERRGQSREARRDASGRARLDGEREVDLRVPQRPAGHLRAAAHDPAQPVATSVAVGPDGAYYVGELKGFPAPTGYSRVWRIEPGSRNVRCGESEKCTLVLDGFTSIIDLAFGPDGRLNVAQIDDASWLAMEIGAGVGGSVHACNLATDDVAGECDELVDELPILTSITYRGSALGLDPRARSRWGRRRPAEPVGPAAGAGSSRDPARLGLSLPRAAEGHAHRARLRRAVARARALARRAADDLGPHGARHLRTPHVRDPADHGARVVLHDGQPDPGDLGVYGFGTAPTTPTTEASSPRARRSRLHACGTSSRAPAAPRSSSASRAPTLRAR